VKKARSKFSSILDQVQAGDEVIIRRRGKEIARICEKGCRLFRSGALTCWEDIIGYFPF